MKKKEYKVKYENGLIKPIDNIVDVENMAEGVVLFFDLRNEKLDIKESNSSKLLKCAGSWSGNDIEECLESLKKTDQIPNSNYLLDTNHCFHIINGNSALINKLNKESTSIFYTSSTIAGELYYMVYKSFDREKNLANINSFLNNLIFLETDQNTAQKYGELKAALIHYYGPKEKEKLRKITSLNLGFKENDLWIAATAIQKSIILLTTDKDFMRIKEAVDLKIDNWV